MREIPPLLVHRPSRFRMVYFLYDEKSGRETLAVEELVRSSFPDVNFLQLAIPSVEMDRYQLETWEATVKPFFVPDSLLIGVGIGGAAACEIQEHWPELSLSVVAINSPMGGLTMNAKRVALYSSDYEPIKYSCDWFEVSNFSFDVSWLRYGILSESGGNLCKFGVAMIVATYMQEANLQGVLDSANLVNPEAAL